MVAKKYFLFFMGIEKRKLNLMPEGEERSFGVTATGENLAQPSGG